MSPKACSCRTKRRSLALHNDDAGAIKNSTFIGNTATFGGAIVTGGLLTIKNSTVTGNTAGFGGGIYVCGVETGGFGFPCFEFQGSLQLKNTVIEDNTPDDISP